MLLDTCVVIDFLRGVASAENFVRSLAEKPSISAVTVAEVFAGLKSQKEEREARAFLASCVVLTLLPSMAETAGAFMRHYRGSHGLEIADTLIAATAEHHRLDLATLNVKHFPMFKRLKAAY